jgi:hypothetical protein
MPVDLWYARSFSLSFLPVVKPVNERRDVSAIFPTRQDFGGRKTSHAHSSGHAKIQMAANANRDLLLPVA